MMRLPAEIKHLCAKIAHERTRPQQWQTAHELRKDAARVLASGAGVEGAVAWLEGLLGDALAQQAAGGSPRPIFTASKVGKPSGISRR